MFPPSPRAPSRNRAILAAAAACLLTGLVVALTLVWPGQAGSAPLRLIVLGQTGDALPPSCPGLYREVGVEDETIRGCEAVGRVSGFQSLAGEVVRPHEAPFDGKIISWSIALSRPSKRSTQANPNDNGYYRLDEKGFFDDVLGRPSMARISVLRKRPNVKPPTYKLIRQSPLQTLNPYFGATVEFALENPLTILEDQIVAITVPTWAPAFGVEVGSPYTWRGSRLSDRCIDDPNSDEDNENLTTESFPQQKVGSRKQYGCYYEGAQLLYTATVVKQPQRAANPGE